MFSRRDVLVLLCGSGASYIFGQFSPFPRGSFEVAAEPATSATCVLAPEKTSGPFFVDERLNRSDIRIDTSDGSTSMGVRLNLKIQLMSVDDGCTPIADARVDIWHADAQGRYSDVPMNETSGRNFLRGYQTSDVNGLVEFVTIYPGWYRGRTVHIHVKVRLTSANSGYHEFTSQLFFPESTNDEVMQAPPYNTRGVRDTVNTSDGIYDGDTELLVPVTGTVSSGFVGKVALGLASGAVASV